MDIHFQHAVLMSCELYCLKLHLYNNQFTLRVQCGLRLRVHFQFRIVSFGDGFRLIRLRVRFRIRLRIRLC